MSTESSFLPDADNPYESSLADTGILGGYQGGLSWVTHVHWLEAGEEMTEELIFEETEE